MADLSGITRIDGVTGVILAGGMSRRMGSNKALLEVGGNPLILSIYNTLSNLFSEVIIVTNSPLDYEFIPCCKVPDIFTGLGAIAGIHSALVHSTSQYTFVTACDMPFLNTDIIKYLCGVRYGEYDAVVPCSQYGLEPLHTVYSSRCENALEIAITNGELKIKNVLKQLKINLISYTELASFTGVAKSFINLNTPEEYAAT